MHSDIPFQVGDEEDEEAYQQKKRMKKARERELKRRRRYSSSSADETEHSRGRKERNEFKSINAESYALNISSLLWPRDNMCRGLVVLTVVLDTHS